MSESVKIELDRYVEFISSLAGVLQIYLFGSYANGTPHEASDIDLMVVIDNNLDPFKTAFKIRRNLTDTDFPIDVVVNRESAFEKAAESATFQKTVKESGVLLYAS